MDRFTPFAMTVCYFGTVATDDARTAGFYARPGRDGFRRDAGAGFGMIAGRGGHAVGMDGADLFGDVAQGLHGPGELPCIGRAGSAPAAEDGAEGFDEADQGLDGPGRGWCVRIHERNMNIVATIVNSEIDVELENIVPSDSHGLLHFVRNDDNGVESVDRFGRKRPRDDDCGGGRRFFHLTRSASR